MKPLEEWPSDVIWFIAVEAAGIPIGSNTIKKMIKAVNDYPEYFSKETRQWAKATDPITKKLISNDKDIRSNDMERGSEKTCQDLSSPDDGS